MYHFRSQPLPSGLTHRYTYIHTHTHTYAHIHTLTLTRRYTHIHTYIIHIHTYMHIHNTYIDIHTYIITYIDRLTFNLMYAYAFLSLSVCCLISCSSACMCSMSKALRHFLCIVVYSTTLPPTVYLYEHSACAVPWISFLKSVFLNVENRKNGCNWYTGRAQSSQTARKSPVLSGGRTTPN